MGLFERICPDHRELEEVRHKNKELTGSLERLKERLANEKESSKQLAWLADTLNRCAEQTWMGTPYQIVWKDAQCSLITLDFLIDPEKKNKTVYLFSYQPGKSCLYAGCIFLKDRDEKDTLFIVDIRGDANCGYGSMMMNALLLYASTHNIRAIHGNLSPTDMNDHMDRLIHFYSKHGFTINKIEGKCSIYREIEHK